MNIDQLTYEQYQEYKIIAELCSQGKYKEFESALKVFKKGLTK